MGRVVGEGGGEGGGSGINLVEGAPVHGPQLNGGGGHNGGGPRRLEQQGCVSKHPPSLHVDLNLASFHLHTTIQPWQPKLKIRQRHDLDIQKTLFR